MLYEIVKTLGGDVYAAGRQANIPGPNHSRRDRSVSVFLNRDGRVIVNSHVDDDWRDILKMLRDKQLIDEAGRPIVGGVAAVTTTEVWTDGDKQSAVERIWSTGVPLCSSLSERYLRETRGIDWELPDCGMLHCPSIPVSAYDKDARFKKPGLILKIEDAAGAICGLQLHYLTSPGVLDTRLSVPRKTIGNYRPGWRVRIDCDAEEMVIGTGFFSTLSACRHFGVPGVAMLSDKNLKHWRPGPNTHSVIIAADNDRGGLESADEARQVLSRLGIRARVEVEPHGLNDFNDYDRKKAQKNGTFLN